MPNLKEKLQYAIGKIAWLILGFLLFLFLFGLFWGGKPSIPRPSTQIVEAKIGERVFFIPKAYLSARLASYSSTSALLVAFYPGTAILPGSVEDLWDQGEWWKHIYILFSYNPNSTISFHDFAVNTTDYLHATEIVGNEYGLIHKTQPPGEIKDNYDVWYEEKDGHYISYITCTEKIIEIDVPQCTHKFRLSQKYSVKITYDKKLLPEWKIIKKNVDTMFESFETKQTSEVYLLKKINELNLTDKKE